MGEPIKLREEERTRCSVWSRVMGYHRPVSYYNIGKKQEFADRMNFKEPKEDSYGGNGLDQGKGNCECNQAVV